MNRITPRRGDSEMVKTVEIEEFLELSQQNPILDVRSPSEYAYGRIPGAISMPLFTDVERAEIGTLYKQQGKDVAVKRGLEIVGPKMRPMVEFAERQTYTDHVLVHCWRGGMRSGSVAWLLQTYGLPVVTLKGGYKRFRSHALESFARKMSLKIITGPTGSGKTDLIKALGSMGQQVVDLEGLANHKGSVFGELGQQKQPSSEHFQNELFWTLRKFDFSKPIWLEDESIGIGKVMIPEPFWRQMGKSPRIHFNMTRDIRIKRLVQEYASFPKGTLNDKIKSLEKKLGGQHAKKALELLEANDFAGVADLLLVYYDRAYRNALIRHKNDLLLDVEADHEDFQKWAQLITEKTKTQYA